MPGSRFVVFEDAGHLPQEAQPQRFAALLTEFWDATEPARLAPDHGSRCCRRGHERLRAKDLADARFFEPLDVDVGARGLWRAL